MQFLDQTQRDPSSLNKTTPYRLYRTQGVTEQQIEIANQFRLNRTGQSQILMDRARLMLPRFSVVVFVPEERYPA